VSVPLSILVLTKNEERNIGACLDSVVGWASDIVVVDSGSIDRTMAICAERGVQTRFHEYVDHPSQMRWSMASIPWKHEWLLVLDADRVVTPALRHEIDDMLSRGSGGIDGFYNPHLQYFRQRPVRGLKTNYLQLVRRARARVDESELVDGRLIVDGPTATLRGAIIESNQNELDLDFWIDKHQKYARRIAIEEILRGEGLLSRSEGVRPRLLGNPDERMVWLKHVWFRMPLYVRPVLFFFYRYVLRLGFLDGWNGLVFHSFQAFWFRLLVDVNIVEYRRKLAEHTLSLQQLLEAAGRTSRVRPADTGDRVLECPKS